MDARTQIEIEEIGVGADRYLFVRPALEPSADFEFVWRDASGVRWSNTLRILHAAEPERWDQFALYRQIISAVRNEYGHWLVPTARTQWSRVRPELKRTIEEWHTSRPGSPA